MYLCILGIFRRSCSTVYSTPYHLSSASITHHSQSVSQSLAGPRMNECVNLVCTSSSSSSSSPRSFKPPPPPPQKKNVRYKPRFSGRTKRNETKRTHMAELSNQIRWIDSTGHVRPRVWSLAAGGYVSWAGGGGGGVPGTIWGGAGGGRGGGKGGSEGGGGGGGGGVSRKHRRDPLGRNWVPKEGFSERGWCEGWGVTDVYIM